MSTPSQKLRDAWLKALLPKVETAGWTSRTARIAAQEAGLTPGERALAAPNGITDLIDHFFIGSTEDMRAALSKQDLSRLRTHERVSAGLVAWLDGLSAHKPVVRKAAGRGLAPWGTGAAVKRVWAIADAIWDAAGDTATDYNRQTKRALLSAVIPSIVLYWLDHEDPEALKDFIDRRLNTAMRVGQTGGKILKPGLEFFERLRQARKPQDL